MSLCVQIWFEGVENCIQSGMQWTVSAVSSAGLGRLVAKLQILIISHQLSPVCAVLHPPVHMLSHTLSHTQRHARLLPTTPLLSVLFSLSHTCRHTQITLYNMQHIINLLLSFHTGDKRTLRLPRLRCLLILIFYHNNLCFLVCLFFSDRSSANVK